MAPPPPFDRESNTEREHNYHFGSNDHPAWLSALPRGTPLPSGVTAMDAISSTVARIPNEQMIEVLGKMKTFILDHPERARTLLTAHPQLAYALFQALLVNEIVDPAILHRMIAARSQQTEVPAAPFPVQTYYVPPQETASVLPPQLSSYSHQQSSYQQSSHAPFMYQTPPSPEPYLPSGGQQTYHPAPQLPSTYASEQGNAQTIGLAVSPAVADTQRVILMKMLQLNDEQVNALPFNERQAIQQLLGGFSSALSFVTFFTAF